MRRLSVPVLALLCLLGGFLVIPASAASDPSVKVTKDKAYYTSGQREVVTATIQNAGSGKSVAISVILPDGSVKNPCASDVDNFDSYSCGFVGYVNHQVRATLYDGTTPITSDTIGVSEIA